MIKVLALAALLVPQVAAQAQWCGKNYQQGQPSVNPGGQFQTPAISKTPLLNFRCWPSVQPFLAGETEGSFIIDAGLTNSEIPGAQVFRGSSVGSKANLDVTVKSGSIVLATGSVPLNSTGHEFSFSLDKLPVSLKSQTVSCTAVLSGLGSQGQSFTTKTNVQHLPQPSNGGSVTKQDFKTGALLVKSSGSSSFEPIIPFGFYTSFSDYLALNLSIVDNAKASGRNIIHPVPTFDNMTAFNEVLQRMQEQGVWLMYDMRGTFMNLTSVREQVEMMKDYPNLLVWYTGDEPDGWEYPQNSTIQASDVINSIDPYHPVSLVLNCFDYFFEEYTQGVTIVMQDTYPVDINATFSIEWGTPCNATLGDCGCDDCEGSFSDISVRVDMFQERLQLDGRSRGVSVWSVPQAFGNDTYWPRYPTPNEFILETILSLNHGSLGIVPWDEASDMPPELLASASILGKALPTITSFVFAPGVSFTSLRSSTFDIGSWSVFSSNQTQTMILGVNLSNAGNQSVSLGPASKSGKEKVQVLLNTGASLAENDKGELTLEFSGLGSIGLVFTQ